MFLTSALMPFGIRMNALIPLSDPVVRKMRTLRMNNASRANRHTLYSHASIHTHVSDHVSARARWASAAVRGPLIILLNRPRSYCNACALAHIYVLTRACASARTCTCTCTRARASVYIRALNGTINLLCRRGDCRGRRKLFGAIECELRYCAPRIEPR